MSAESFAPPWEPGTLLAERSDACPDCAAGIRFLRDLGGRPQLRIEHDDGCPTFARIEADVAAQRRAADDQSNALRRVR